MSNLYVSVDSDSRRKPVTSSGNKELSSHLRSWDFGILVEATRDGASEKFKIYRTGGSNNPNDKELIRTIERITL